MCSNFSEISKKLVTLALVSNEKMFISSKILACYINSRVFNKFLNQSDSKRLEKFSRLASMGIVDIACITGIILKTLLSAVF